MVFIIRVAVSYHHFGTSIKPNDLIKFYLGFDLVSCEVMFDPLLYLAEDGGAGGTGDITSAIPGY